MKYNMKPETKECDVEKEWQPLQREKQGNWLKTKKIKLGSCSGLALALALARLFLDNNITHTSSNFRSRSDFLHNRCPSRLRDWFMTFQLSSLQEVLGASWYTSPMIDEFLDWRLLMILQFKNQRLSSPITETLTLLLSPVLLAVSPPLSLICFQWSHALRMKTIWPIVAALIGSENSISMNLRKCQDVLQHKTALQSGLVFPSSSKGCFSPFGTT